MSVESALVGAEENENEKDPLVWTCGVERCDLVAHYSVCVNRAAHGYISRY